MKDCFAPFTDVIYKKEDEGFSVSVWGRTYRYHRSLFPVSITTAGREMLASPMTLHATFRGVEKPFEAWEYTLISSTEEQTVIALSAHGGNVLINATLTFAFDGYIETDFRIVPFWSDPLHNDPAGTSVPQLDGLWFRCETAKENATLLSYWPNAANSVIARPDIVNSGKLCSRAFPFKPYIWWGWEEGGMGISCETEENIQLRDPDKCIVVEEHEKTVTLRWNLLENMPYDWQGRKDLWADALSPICYTFGIQATPVKPMPAKRAWVYRRYHLLRVVKSGLPEGDMPERMEKAGVEYLVLHMDWCLPENYGIVWDKDKFHETVKRFHDRGIKVLVYYGYEYSTIMPGWRKHAPEYLIRNPAGHYVGGWQPPHLRAYMCCYQSAYADAIRDNILDMMDTYHLDGIYTDGMSIPWGCANESHGCGWRDHNGVLHPTFPITAVRKLVKELYGEIHARGGVVEVHQSSCIIMPIMSFADTIWDGENIQPSLEKDLGFLDLDAFRCEYAGMNLGVPTTFIAYTSEKMQISGISALTLVHNVFPKAINLPDLEYLSTIWKLFRENDMEDAVFVPYWRSDRRATAQGLTCSEYHMGDETVAVCANLTGEDAEVSVTLPGAAKAVELLSGKALEGENGTFRWRAQRYRPYYVKFRK